MDILEGWHLSLNRISNCLFYNFFLIATDLGHKFAIRVLAGDEEVHRLLQFHVKSH